MVSFEVRTKLLSLDALSLKIGMNGSAGSRSKGQKMKFGKKSWVEKYTWFRLFSTLPKTANLEKHLESVIKRIGKSKVFKKGILPKDSHLSICIAEVYDVRERAYFQIDIPEKLISWCGKQNVSIEVVAYPGSN